MSNALPFRQPAEPAFDPAPEPPSAHLLADLLAMNEEMVVQLRLEQLSVIGTARFLSTMIEQHEKTAATLRAQLEKQRSDLFVLPSGPAETIDFTSL
jgi:hypothetical protein